MNISTISVSTGILVATGIPASTAGKSQERLIQRFPVALLPVYTDGPINILIVDDEPKNLTVLEAVLDDPNYRLVRAESANHALLALVEEEFALLILDIRMPGMTGFELAVMIKERKKTAQVPIIFLTAYYNEDQHVLEGYGTGAVDYLHKPVNAVILRSKVAVFAELYRKNRALLAEVTERRRAEEQLRELNETLDQRVMQRTKALSDQQFYTRSLIESNIDAIMTTDPRGIITDVNKQMEAITGCTRDEMIGAPLKNYFTDPERAEVAIKLVLSATKVNDYEFTAHSRNGKETVVSFNATTFYDRDRKLQGVFATARDVTERKRMDQELVSAKFIAEKSSQAKSNFLSSMSHELRTPLNAILGFAQLLESGTPQPTESQDKRLQQILKAGWYLLDLINEILDLSVIESGNMVLQIEPVPLAQVIRDCQGMILPQAAKRDIQISFPPDDSTLFVVADRTRLKQVLVNLLSNAIKYNRKQGTVELTCQSLSAERMRISIKDSGAGLSAEKMQQLFQPFNRLGQESSTEEGTGIGLVVAKRLVERMGGSIGVESTVGVGSEFWLELACSAAPAFVPKKIPSAHPKTNSPGDVTQFTLLYVEDNPANLQLVEEILAERPHISMLSAKDGDEGIALARTHLPHVILMDINLPGISGIEAMNILHADAATRHIPIIALSANAMFEDIEKGIAAGFFRYLTKPVIIKELMKALNESIRHSANRQADINMTETIQTGEIS